MIGLKQTEGRLHFFAVTLTASVQEGKMPIMALASAVHGHKAWVGRWGSWWGKQMGLAGTEKTHHRAKTACQTGVKGSRPWRCSGYSSVSIAMNTGCCNSSLWQAVCLNAAPPEIVLAAARDMKATL
ncbi:MAG: hypothetical protein FRX49_00650 [Trebouxia sp. A1-2]|nr:MAG: hypothetical protein FRX49_00650 [Trebouxia sp. A1-2]